MENITNTIAAHDDVIKWTHFLRYWPFVRGIHRSPVNSPHKGQWCGALVFPLTCAWINGWANNREPGDLRRHRVHHDVTVMWYYGSPRRQAISSHVINYVEQMGPSLSLGSISCTASVMNNTNIFSPATQKIKSSNGRLWGCQTGAKSEHPKVVQNSSFEWVVEWLL